MKFLWGSFDGTDVPISRSGAVVVGESAGALEKRTDAVATDAPIPRLASPPSSSSSAIDADFRVAVRCTLSLAAAALSLSLWVMAAFMLNTLLRGRFWSEQLIIMPGAAGAVGSRGSPGSMDMVRGGGRSSGPKESVFSRTNSSRSTVDEEATENRGLGSAIFSENRIFGGARQTERTVSGRHTVDRTKNRRIAVGLICYRINPLFV